MRAISLTISSVNAPDTVDVPIRIVGLRRTVSARSIDPPSPLRTLSLHQQGERTEPENHASPSYHPLTIRFCRYTKMAVGFFFA